MLELKDLLGNQIKAKHIFYVIDACYSGSILTRGSGLDIERSNDFAYLKEITRESVRYALTAGDEGQEVLDGGPKTEGHSVFTYRFIEALKRADGYITSSDISKIIEKKVFSDARDMGQTQTPQYGRLSGMGDFVFLTRGEKQLASAERELASNFH